MLGLLSEQVSELKLVDENEERCLPSGGFAFNADPVGRRNGRAPKSDMKDVLVRRELPKFDLKIKATVEAA